MFWRDRCVVDLKERCVTDSPHKTDHPLHSSWSIETVPQWTTVSYTWCSSTPNCLLINWTCCLPKVVSRLIDLAIPGDEDELACATGFHCGVTMGAFSCQPVSGGAFYPYGSYIERGLDWTGPSLSLIWWEHGEHNLSHMVGRRMGVLGGLFCVTNLVIKKQ